MAPGGRDIDARQDRASARFPWQLGLAGFAWMGLGVTILGAAFSQSRDFFADSASVGRIIGALGGRYVEGAEHSNRPTLLIVLGFVTLLFAVLLMVGQGWARHALAVFGLAALFMIAFNGRWQAILVTLFFVLGMVPLLSKRVADYFGER